MKSDIAGSRAQPCGLLGAVKDNDVGCEKGENNAIARVQDGILNDGPITIAPFLVLSVRLNGVFSESIGK